MKQKVFELYQQGLSKREISKITSTPRTTVRRWISEALVNGVAEVANRPEAESRVGSGKSYGDVPLGQGFGGPGYSFADEFHGELQFDRPYILAMANSGPNTNGSQFFITSAPTTWLNRKHTIFGEVKDAASQAVVDKIESTPTGAQDKPVTPVVINSVTIA